MDGIVSAIKEYLSPELIFAIPVMMALGSLLKRSHRVSDTLIPPILAIAGIPMALLISVANRYDPMTKPQLIVWLLTGIGQGIFLGYSAVGVHQQLKQNQEYKNLKIWDKKEELLKELKEELKNKEEI
ncbi:MAG: phage holin family protein [Peptoniphilus sp.]|uniref:phage holin family protein n=1 Tax=Peptoniphilus sp. TaxID=1971214 RepID=UPI002A755F4A|nr:phage holin family protein [Peptoniphilus sp.]MDY2986302.1 phage holin family protein [Peptoniphilus sp.]